MVDGNWSQPGKERDPALSMRSRQDQFSNVNPFTTGHLDNFSATKMVNRVHLLNNSIKI